MFRIFLCLCFFVTALQVKAQELPIPKYQDLKVCSYDSLQKAFYTYRPNNRKLAKVYAGAYYRKAVEKNDVVERYRGAHRYALAYNILGEKDSALHFINIALKESDKASDTQQYASSLYLKGNIYYSATIYMKAVLNYTEAYELIKKENDSIKLAIIANSIALVKNHIGETKEALYLAKNNLLFYEKLHKKNDPRLKDFDYINALLNISNAYTHLAEEYPKYKIAYSDSALVYCLQGIDKSIRANDNEAYSELLSIKGIINQTKGNYEESRDDFNTAEKIIMDLNSVNELPNLYFYQGKNYFLQKDIDNALIYFLKVDSIVNKNNIISILSQENNILLAKCYEQKNNIKKQAHYLKMFTSKYAEIDEINKKASKKIYYKYYESSFKSKINQLEKTLKTAEHSTSFLKKISFLLLGIIILGMIYYYVVRRNYRNRFETIIKELNEAKKEKVAQAPSSKDYKISDENIQKILRGLELFEQEKMFLQQKCSINFLAKEIDTNATYLSKTLQSHKKKKFTKYITDLRIDYALVQLKENKKFRAYDVKSIALELGFNTSESFSKAFKKHTGIYPSFYIKKLNSLES